MSVPVTRHACVKYAKRILNQQTVDKRQMSLIARHLERAIRQYVHSGMKLEDTRIKAPDFNCVLRFRGNKLTTITRT